MNNQDARPLTARWDWRLGLVFLAAWLQLPAGRASVVHCTYDGAGRLVGVQYDASTQLTHHYDPSGSVRLTSAFASAAADLAVTYASVPATPLAGLPFSLLITAANLTSIRATDVRLSGEIPAGLDILSAISSKGTCSVEGTQLTCDFGNLEPGEHVLVQLSVQSGSSGQFPLSLTMIAGNDPNPGNNLSSETLTVQQPLSLNLRLAGAEGDPAEISWPALADGLVLEETPSLQPPVQWSPTAPPSIIGDLLRVHVILGTEDRFFRLRWPD